MRISRLIFFLIFLSSSAFALTPPMPVDQLTQQADLIVEGEVGAPIQCLGKVSENTCYVELKYSVPMKVLQAKKGQAKIGETLKITFHWYNYEKSHCVGDQAAVLHSGDKGIFYLKRLEDGTFMPFHWSAADVKSPGSGELPRCP